MTAPDPVPAAEPPPVWAEPTEYAVGVVPRSHPDCDLYAITVQWRGEGSWAVHLRSRCLGSDGMWSYESISSEREDEWLAAHRFDLDTALRLARETAPLVRVNGKVAMDVAQEAARRG